MSETESESECLGEYVIATNAIIVQALVQVRSQTQPVVVEQYAEQMSDGAIFPPVVVFQETDNDNYRLADGFHRLAACLQAGGDRIRAVIYRGDLAAAQRYAAGANARHGLRMSVADKRRALEMVLDNPLCQAWSNREIAAHCGVSHTFVATFRRERENWRGNVSPTPVIAPAFVRQPQPIPDRLLDAGDTEQPTPHHVATLPPINFTNRRSGSNPVPRQAADEILPAPKRSCYVSWSYADSDGNVVEGKTDLFLFNLPPAVRKALLYALGVGHD